MALANTLTGLIPTLYAARDIISRELTGFIPAVTIDASSARAALNQTVRIHVVPAMTAGNITPAMTPPTPNGVTVGYTDMSITKARQVQIPWSGEEQQSINSGGGNPQSPGIDNVLRDEITQAMRTLTNEIESDLAGLWIYASQAYGTAGNTPFATTLGDPAQVRKILDDNGAPPSDRQLVINTAAGAALRTLAQLTKVNEGGTDATLRRGELLNIHGFSIRESAQIATSVPGTAASATTNTAGYAVGATVITLASAGTGTLVAGDIITFAGDTHKYLIVAGDTDVSNGGTFTIAEPGLRVALPASAVAITRGAAGVQNMAFPRSSIILMNRAPYLPNNGDIASDRMMVTDPQTGLTFEVARYAGYHANFLEVSMCWGVKAVMPRHIATLLG
jgi:hypothetical protein